MKKLVSLLLATMLLLTCIPLGAVSVSAATSGDYEYSIYNGTATITGYTGPGGTITIPSTLGGYPVTGIDYWAFEYCINLTSVTIPDSVTYIGEAAFRHCDNLTFIGVAPGNTNYCSLDGVLFNKNKTTLIQFPVKKAGDYSIPDSVTSIGDYMFLGCTRLTSVTIPNSVTTIGNYAFYNCSSLTSVTIPDSVTTIGDLAFCSCDSLTSVTIPDSVTTIGDEAFEYCISLSSITIPDSVTSIGEQAFCSSEGCTIVIHCNRNSEAHQWSVSHDHPFVLHDSTDEESIVSGKVGKYSWVLDKRIGTLSLSGSGNLADFSSLSAPWKIYAPYISSVELPDSMTSIGSCAFSNLDNLTSVFIPDSVTKIGEKAFSDCYNLSSVIIPNSVTSIDSKAFTYCHSLTSVDIGDGVTYIGYRAFYYCVNLTSVNIGNSVTDIGGEAFGMCESLSLVTLPNSVTSIGNQAFYNCNLSEMTIPFRVTYIGSGCFLGCSSLNKVIVYSTDCYSFGDWGLNYNQTIYGFVGSAAETLAEEMGAEFIDIETIHNHSYSPVTCIDDSVCPVCGKVGTKKLGHNYTTITKKATTSANGYTVKRCSVCDMEAGKKTLYKVSSVTLSKTSFTYNGKVQKPTVTVKNSAGTKLTEGTSYTVTYSSGCKNAGTYKVTVKFKGNYTGTVTKTFKINPQDVSKCTVTLSKTSFTYNGKVQKPTVTVKNSAGTKLTEGTSYTVTYASGCKNAGTYKVTVKFKGSYSGTKTLTFKINPQNVSKCKVTLSTASYTYNGAVKKPTVTVKNAAGTKLTLNGSYTVTYATGRKNVGTYKVTVKMKGNYTGTKTITFKILPTKTSISSLTAGTKKLTVKWAKKTTQVTGYQIQYSTSKSFSSYKSKTITKNSTVSTSLTGLSAKKTYYVRIRTYKTVNGVKVYSGWSTVKSLKTK